MHCTLDITPIFGNDDSRGPQNVPLLTEFANRTATRGLETRLHFVFHSALDYIDKKGIILCHPVPCIVRLRHGFLYILPFVHSVLLECKRKYAILS